MHDAAGDIGAPGGQKCGYIGDLFGQSHALQGNAGQDLAADGLREAGRHLRFDKAGCNGIDEDISPFQFAGQRFREGVQGCFFHGIGNLAPIACMADHAGNIDDAAAVRPQHEQADDPFGQVPGPPKERPLGVKLLDFHGMNVGVDRDAGIVDQDIHTRHPAFQIRHQGFDLIDVRQICVQEKAVVQIVQKRPGRPFTGVVMNAHPKSLGCKRTAAGRSDAGGAAGDKGNGFFMYRFYVHAFIL